MADVVVSTFCVHRPVAQLYTKKWLHMAIYIATPALLMQSAKLLVTQHGQKIVTWSAD